MRSLTRRVVGVRAALIVVVLCPLIGLVLFAAGVIGSAHREVESSHRTRVVSEQASSAAALAGALSVERYWTASAAAIQDLGFEAEVVDAVIGVDIPTELQDARGQTDALLETDERPRIDAPLASARRLADAAAFKESYGAYAAVEQVTELEVERQLLRLRSTALHTGDSSELLNTASALQEAIALRSDAYGMVGGLFGARFPAQTITERPDLDLVESRARYDDAWMLLDTEVADGSATDQVLAAIRTDPQVQRFWAVVDIEIASMSDPVSGDPPDVEAVAIDAAADFANASAAVDLHGELVTAAQADVRAAGEEVAAHADRAQRNVLLGVGAVMVVTIAVLALVGRWIVRSLDGISRSASAMNEGELGTPAPVVGPREFRLTAEALNGAAANLESAEAQALALARGDADTVAETSVPGRLGASLHEAFDRLGSSLREQEVLRRELEHEATHDGLTGLANRSAIMARLSDAVDRAREAGTGVALLFIDLDNFKSINDLHGHDIGDRVLRRIGRRLTGAARVEDSVGRLGGDEFVVVAEGITGPDDAIGLAERVTEVVTRPLQTSVGTVTPEVSIGVAVGLDDEVSPARLLTDADLAVYEAKRSGGESIEVCTPALRKDSARRLAVEGELREAIDSGHLSVHYQAIVAARDITFSGFEALVRWPRSDGSSRSPADFVPVAERSNLIIDLDRWVIGETLRRLAIWSRTPATAELRVAVNISARHASTRGFAAEIVRSLDHHGVDPHRFTVELTESALIDNESQIISELLWLRRHGVDIALDDFGTGYTSLALLDRLPISTLKLDETLTSNLEVERRRAVAALIIETAHTIGMQVTAEGVETDEQARHLRDLGVDALQGFLFHRPTDARAAVETARERGYLSEVGPDPGGLSSRTRA